MRRAQSEVDEILIAGESGTIDGARIQRLRDRLGAAEDALLPLRRDPTENVDNLVAALDVCLDAARTAASRIAASDTPGARTAIADGLRPGLDRIFALLLGSSRTDRELAAGVVGRIEVVRQRSHQIGVALDLGCAVVAIAAAIVVLGAVRRYTRLLEEHGRMLEDRANELEAFAGRVAHDIVSPLSAVSLAVTHARRANEDPAVVRSLLRGESSLRRVSAIVQGLLDFARSGATPERGAATPLAEVAEGVLDELSPEAEAAKITLAMEPLPDVLVACARGVLVSLLSNVLRNAIKYMGNAPKRVVTVRARMLKGVVHVEVEDTGPGVPSGMETMIFDMYVRAERNQPGIGLGLATVKRLAVAHGGTVGVRAAKEAGSIFWFELPKVETAAATGRVLHARSA